MEGCFTAFKKFPSSCWVPYEETDRMQSLAQLSSFCSGLQIPAVAKIQTDLCWQNNSSNSPGNLNTNTLSPLLSYGIQSSAKTLLYAGFAVLILWMVVQFSSIFHIITSFSALGVKKLMLQFHRQLILPVPWSQKRSMNNSSQTSFFHFCFPFWGKDKSDWKSWVFPLLHFTYSTRVRTSVLETFFHILFDLWASITVILYYIVSSHITLIYLVN